MTKRELAAKGVCIIPHYVCANCGKEFDRGLLALAHQATHYVVDHIIVGVFQLTQFGTNCTEEAFRDYCTWRGQHPGDWTGPGWYVNPDHDTDDHAEYILEPIAVFCARRRSALEAEQRLIAAIEAATLQPQPEVLEDSVQAQKDAET